MRIPWASPPTVSDAAKLGLKGQPVPITGETQYELLLQSVDTFAFTTPGDFGPFTEVDSAANIAVTGGVMTIKGAGAFNNNGAWLTTLKATTTPGAFRIKVALKTAPGVCALGFNDATELNNARSLCLKAYTSATNEYLVTEVTGKITATPWVNGTQYEFQFEWDPAADTETIWKRVAGGSWGLYARYYLGASLPATLGLQILPYTAYATPWEIDDYECLYGYATDGPTLTYVADAGAGKTFDGWVFTNLAAVGSWATTNVLFKYSFDDGTPAYNETWLSLALLKEVTTLTTRKRYARLMVQVNSDGATQQYAGEINADDATAGGGDFPAVDSVIAPDTVQLVEGTGSSGEVTYPAQPAISVARLSDTSARVTVDGDAGVTNYVEYADFADMEWAAGGYRSGDGTVDITGLTSGHTYLIAAYSLHTSGGISEWSDAEIYTAGPASGAVGTYATFIQALRDAVKNSAALAAKITDGLPAAHVKLGRAVNTDSGSTAHAAIIAAGPVIYVRPAPESWSPRNEDTALGELAAEITICEAFDQSGSDDLLTALNFVDALRQELLSGADGTGGSASWAAGGGNVRIGVDGPHGNEGYNEVHTHLRITATVPEAV